MKIAHLADIHIHNLKAHTEYNILFKRLLKSLITTKPDIIVIVGDLYESWIEISNEAEYLASYLLNEMAKISPVYIAYGNHDCRKKNKNRLNSVESLVKVMNNSNIHYLGKSDFYDIDDTFTFVNYEHLDKDNDVWKNKVKDDNKVYIGLYHDPIYQSKTFLNETFDNRYKPITYFENNDYLFLGDIHMLQYFNNGKAAYCSSTIQQDHGENPIEHGYLLWDIQDRNTFNTVFHDIPNEYNYITLNIDQGFNYDNIILDNKHITKYSEVKVKWRDVSSITEDKDIKNRIEQYLKDKYLLEKDVKFSRTSIIKNIGEINLDENIDVLDLEKQKELFIEFLEVNGYDNDVINKILEYDLIINERLNESVENLNSRWSILSCWFNNFKSYGDDNLLELSDKQGIIQINGDNQAGKTTILDVITYVLYGTTITTNNKKKHGDNRYINKNRDLDSCDSGVIIKINNEIFTLVRETTRKWNREGSKLSGCTSSLEIYCGTDITEKNKLTGENRIKTQKFIEESIGTFNDFIRIVLTTADNLNDLLSMDRAIFIDSISKDAGFDIFDKKLNELKEYVKEETSEFITINEKELETENKELSDKITLYEEKLVIYEKNILDKNKEKHLLNEKRSLLNNSLHKIVTSIESVNIDEVQNKISELELSIKESKEVIANIDTVSKSFKEFDYNNIITIDNSIKTLNTEISNLRNEYQLCEKTIMNIESSIKDIINSKENKITDAKNNIRLENKDLENELTKLRETFSNSVRDYTISLKDEISTINKDKTEYKQKIDKLISDKLILDSDNKVLEESKICPTCERELEKKDIETINKKVLHNKSIISDLEKDIKDLEPIYNDFSDKIEKVEKILTDISNKIYPDSLQKIFSESKQEAEKIKKKISDNNEILETDNIVIDFSIENNKIDNLHKEIDILKTDISSINNKISDKNNELSVLETNKTSLLTEKDVYEKTKLYISSKDSYLLEIEKTNNIIEKYNILIKEKEKCSEQIKENIIINEKIKTVDQNIYDLTDIIEHLNTEKQSIIFNIEKSAEKYENNISLIEKHNNQEKIKHYLNVYKKCVHRDGLPSFLLKKSINIINEELKHLLEDVDFDIYFTEDLILELKHDISPNTIECVTSSGMERTFSAIALKLALRRINTKSKPNFLIFDEIMGKLNKKNVEKFNNLIAQISKEIDNVIIIEHHNNIEYDYIIDVEKDKYGVSKFVIS